MSKSKFYKIFSLYITYIRVLYVCNRWLSPKEEQPTYKSQYEELRKLYITQQYWAPKYWEIMGCSSTKLVSKESAYLHWRYRYCGMQKHWFHMVQPSPWPILAAVGALMLVFGAVMTFHFYKLGIVLLIFGGSQVICIMYVWWRDIVRESTHMGYHTKVVVRGLRSGIVSFIISEIMFFSSFFWAFFYSSIAPSVFIGAQWPPLGIYIVNPYQICLLNTLILLCSGSTITLSHHCLCSKFFRFVFLGSSWTNRCNIMSFLVVYKSKFYSSILYYNYKIYSINRNKAYFINEHNTWIKSIYTNLSWYQSIFKRDILNFVNYRKREGPSINNIIAYVYSFKNIYEKWVIQYTLLYHISYISYVKINIYLNHFGQYEVRNRFNVIQNDKDLMLIKYKFHITSEQMQLVMFLVTIVLALESTCWQLFEYYEALFYIIDGVYGSTFYMLTGFHGSHVIVGTIFLVVCYVRMRLMHFSAAHHVGFEAAIRYWHFVDVVRLFLYISIYVWSAGQCSFMIK